MLKVIFIGYAETLYMNKYLFAGLTKKGMYKFYNAISSDSITGIGCQVGCWQEGLVGYVLINCLNMFNTINIRLGLFRE